MEQAVQIMSGVAFLILGLAVLLRPGDWGAWISAIAARGTNGILTLGGVNILLGAFIIGFHWVWSGAAALLTVVGLFILARGMLCLFCPECVLGMMEKIKPRLIGLMRLGSVVTITIALIVLYAAFQGA